MFMLTSTFIVHLLFIPPSIVSTFNTLLGLWWFPILKVPSWLRMFQLSNGKNSKENSQQFRSWVAEYKPLDGYKGWGA
jgi:hypothetical protein